MRNASKVPWVSLAMLLICLAACAPNYTSSMVSSRPEGGANPFVVPVESGDQIVMSLVDGTVLYGDFVGLSDSSISINNCSVKNRFNFYSPTDPADIPFEDIEEIWISEREQSHSLSTGIVIGLFVPLIILGGV